MRPLLLAAAGFILSAPASAQQRWLLRGRSTQPLCDEDFSAFRFPPERGPLVPPEEWEDRALRPSLLFIQQEVCRCLPARRSHHPSEVKINLHIRPNAGQITLEYRVASPETQPLEQMVACLGAPTLMVEPMPYVSDIVTEYGREEEVLRYPILLGFEQDARSQR